MMAKAVRFATLAATALAMGHAPLFAQVDASSKSSPVAAEEAVKPVLPSRVDYPDAGQAFGMGWHYNGDVTAPVLSFMSPQTDNRFWTMACKRQADGTVRISNMIAAAPKELVAGDRFGFTVRIDDGRSIGVLARMMPTGDADKKSYMPQFYLPGSHDLLTAMAQGERAFVNLNGHKFSVHLNGSGEALKNFLNACQ
ncbi:hypothetical protein [Parasphingorhabdus sp.]|uniref:hypothetical protein n=1 Tax=Parasphingorhabdus sp. TaxID=2709688 RepID=UPI002F93FC0A